MLHACAPSSLRRSATASAARQGRQLQSWAACCPARRAEPLVQTLAAVSGRRWRLSARLAWAGSVNGPFSLNFAGEHLGHSPSGRQARQPARIITRAGRWGRRALGVRLHLGKTRFKSHFLFDMSTRSSLVGTFCLLSIV